MIRASVLMWMLLLCASLAWAEQDADHHQRLTAYKADADAVQADVEKAREMILEQTNAFRKEQGVDLVKSDPKLASTAQQFAEFMASHLKYGHEADGKQVDQRVKAQKYSFCMVSENIAYRFDTKGMTTQQIATHLTQAWIDSAPHRKNMIDPHVTGVGMGLARSENGVYFGVQVYARPTSAAIEVRFENRSRSTIQYTIGEKNYKLAPRAIREHKLCFPQPIAFELPPGSNAPDKDALTPTKPTTYSVTSAGDGVSVRVK